MGAAEDRLAEQLESAEDEIRELKYQVSRLEDRLPWTEHLTLEESNLPVPRLEMLWEKGKFPRGYNFRCSTRLVYRHTLGHLVGIPFYETLRGSEISPDEYGKIDTPFRDGVHIRNDARQLQLPAFVIWNGKVEQIDLDE